MEVGALRSSDPERLGSYALIGRLGEGGQGTVFLAEAEGGRRVAIKLLHSELTSDDKARARFLRELDVAKRVAPFCTAQVIDADATGDRPYIVSEFVDGPSLNQQVLAEGPLRGAALDRLAVGTATALAAIHQAEIIHRDFKPHNVLIGPDGPRVIDFGVARAISGSTTLTSKVIGTPSYMAPEQIRGEEVGTPADVFCWAATLAFAATGEPPFGQDSIPAVINRILHEEPRLGDHLDGALRDLVVRCLAKEPARRPHARQVLMRLLGHEEFAAPKAAAESIAESTGAADDEDAMLAFGSVLAAEIGDETGGDEPAAADPRNSGPIGSVRPVGDLGATQGFGFDQGTGRLPTPAEWAAANTNPHDAPVRARRGGLREALGGSGRAAVLAGAAAFLVAIVVVSAVLALTSGDKGKAGQKVSDPSGEPAQTTQSPTATYSQRRQRPTEAPATSLEPTPTGSGSPTYSPTPTYTPSPSPTTSEPVPSSPPPSSEHSPSGTPSDPSSGGATPSGGTGGTSGTGDKGGTGGTGAKAARQATD